MLVWKSLANRCNSFMFFAVEQGKTRENVDCSRKGRAREGEAGEQGEQGTEVCSRYVVEGAGIDREHTSVPCSPTEPWGPSACLRGEVAGLGQGIGALPCATSSIVIAFSL